MRGRTFGWVFAACLTLAASYGVIRRAESSRTEQPASNSDYRPLDLVLTADQAIAELRSRIELDPTIAFNHLLLGQMYVRKAKETGDLASYDLAETAVRQGLALDHDSLMGQATLAQVLCAKHRFAEGLELAQRAYANNPSKPQILLLIGDAQLELGHYSQAAKTFRELEHKDPLARLLSRRARFAELKGRTDEAIELMRQASAEEARAALSAEGRAWYPTRIGELNLNVGRIAEAEKEYEAALRESPGYHAALVGLAKVKTSQGKYDEAIDLYKRASTISPNLRTLAELGDLYAKIGDDSLAELYYDRVEQTGVDVFAKLGKDVVARLGGGIAERAAAERAAHDRELSLFYCDHDRNLTEALRLARRDLAARRDIYAYDTLAWALYKNGRYREAAASMRRALKLGTRDAMLYYHAGMIWNRVGDAEKAREYLRRALALHPEFALFQAEVARRTLAEIESG